MRYLTLDNDTASKLFLALENSTGEAVLPPADPVELAPAHEPQKPPTPPATPPAPVQVVSNDALVNYVFGTQQDIAGQFSQIHNYYMTRLDLQTPEDIVKAYRDTHAPAASAGGDTMWNAGTGFPVENINYPDDAFYLFRMGQIKGKPLWYLVLAGTQTQIGALIQRVGAGADIAPAQAFNVENYKGPLVAYVARVP